MESPHQPDEEPEAVKKPVLPVVTEQDRENFRIREEIAARQEAEYRECYLLAFGAFGPDWLPSHRHFLIDKAESARVRYMQERPQVAATVYTVRHADGRTRHFTVEDGSVKECASYEAGFGAMLLEPHPTMTIEVRGQRVHPHRYDLCFAPYELYHPKTAEQLAALRETRERKKDEKWAEEYPLFALAGFKRKE
jgi:hypothetical protein